MKKLLTVMAFSVGLFANAQTGNLFKPVKEIALRTPSVPIVVSDPHFSIWSPYDKLMEGSTEHWTTAKKPLVGALRVDGKVYQMCIRDRDWGSIRFFLYFQAIIREFCSIDTPKTCLLYTSDVYKRQNQVCAQCFCIFS